LIVIIFRASGTLGEDGIRSLITAVRDIADAGDIAAGVMDYEKAGSSPPVIASAVMHAVRASDRGRSIGRSFDSEVMRYTSGRRQVSHAIMEMGISTGTRDFVFFAVSRDRPCSKGGGDEGTEIGTGIGIPDDGESLMKAVVAVAGHAGLEPVGFIPVRDRRSELSVREKELLERMALLDVST